MSGLSLAVDPTALLAEQVAELPQKDELCGAFWGLVVLRSAGVRSDPAGRPLDQEAVALSAGSRLSPQPRDGSRPPGEPARDDYRIALPVDARLPGTSAAGLARALGELSAGRLTVVPATGEWDAERLRALLEELVALARPPIAVIANLHTGMLWPPVISAERRARYLEDGDDAGPRSDWSIGHFTALVHLHPGAHGDLIEVADTYRSRGVDGRHLQPLPRVAAALDGDRARGLLIVVDRDADHVREMIELAGLIPWLWDDEDPIDG